MKENYYIASWSGGKDSTFMVDELLRRGDPLDELLFCDTGYEFPEMYAYIEKCKAYWESKYPNLKITLLNYGKGKEIWKKWAEGKYVRGNYKGLTRGFPFPLGMSWCTRELKINPMEEHLSTLSEYEIYEYIGIAVDEPKRVPVDWKNKIFPMVTWGITEQQAEDTLKERGLHNPLYNHFKRTGCWLCPKQSEKALKTLKDFYPELWEELKDMDKKYTDMEAPKGFKNVGVEVVTSGLEGKQYVRELNEEPLGCFCK
ncbi:putative Phosphoadenosine phosphosulphate reductase domain-containing protein [uncultured Thiomicrorhabdus sp.]